MVGAAASDVTQPGLQRFGSQRRAFLRLALGIGALALACRDASIEGAPESANTSPDARLEVTEMLRAARDVIHHAADGGGRAWLESAEPARPQAGSSGRFTIVYEVGPLGVAEGGMIYLQVSPFWGWSTPQLLDAEAPGFTRIESEADGVELEAETLDLQLLGIRVGGRALAEGEQLRIVYGAGSAGATVDEYAGRRSPFWVAVDGDGDGVRKTLVDSPSVDIVAGPPGRLVVTLPTVARPGETVRVSVAILDPRGSAGVSVEGVVTLADAAPVLELPERVTFTKADAGVKVIEAVVRETGVVRVSAEAEGRDYRSPHMTPQGPSKTLWGFEQLAWLKRTLLESDAVFKILISPTPLVGPDDANQADRPDSTA